MGQGEVIRSMMTPIYSNGNSIIQTTNGLAGSSGCCCPKCRPCICGGAEVPIGNNSKQIIFTAGTTAGGMNIGDSCTYCMSPHFLYVTTSPVQTSLKCNSSGYNYMDIELAQLVYGQYAGAASGSCVTSGLYRIRLFICELYPEQINCANGDDASYELTGWEFLTSDFAGADFIGNITLGDFCPAP